ncbi:MAG: TonB-dependent receptor [Verrucomicrobiota bacterium]
MKITRNELLKASGPVLLITIASVRTLHSEPAPETPAAASELPSIVVTAQRTALLSGDVITSKDLLQLPQRSLDGILRSVPGFRLYRRTDSLTSHPTSQGVSLGNVGPNGASRALVLLDGVPVNDPFGGWVPWSRFAPVTLSSVAVTPNGSPDNLRPGMPGGTISIESRMLTDAPFVLLEAATGNFLTQHFSGAFAQDGNHGTTRLFGSVQEFEYSGYRLIPEEQKGQVDVRAFTRAYSMDAGLRQRLSPTSDWNVTLRGQYWREQRGNGTQLANNRSEARDFSIRLEKQSSPEEWSGSWALFYQRRAFASTFTSVAANRNSETLSLDQYAVPTESTGFLQHVQVPVSDNHLLSLSNRMSVTEGATFEKFGNLGAGFTRAREAGGTQHEGELSLADTWRISPKWTLTSALRGTLHNDSRGHLRESDLATGTLLKNQIAPSRQLEALDFGLTARWQPTAVLEFGGSIFSSHRYPTLNELFRPFRVGNTVTLGNPSLEPEKLLGADLSSRWQVNKRLSLHGRVFASELQDAISNVSLVKGPGNIGDWGVLPVGGVGARRENLDRVEVHGLELGAQIDLPYTMRSEVRWLLSDSLVKKAEIQRGLEGRQLAQLPQQQLIWNLSGGGRGWHWNIDARYSSGQFDDDQNERRLSAYLCFDAMLRRDLGKGREVFVSLENISDTQIQTKRDADGTLGITSPRSLTVGFRCLF